MGSSLLAQQQLVEPAPRRRIIVPRDTLGCAGWWGVDPSTRRVAIAYVARGGRRGVSTASFADLEGGARLEHIYRETTRFVSQQLLADAERWPLPGLVWVEQPSGKQENPALSYATGVIQAAIHAAVMEDYGYSVKIETVPSSSWKKLACGNGAIWKPKRSDNREYGVLTWARANGYAGHSWDEADALGVAEAARREVALDER